MRNYSVRKNIGRLGFTLLEILIAVAIVIIVVGISIPTFISVRKNVRTKSLDATAKQIYYLAQDELTEAKEQGRLSAVYDALTAVSNGQSLYDTKAANAKFSTETGIWSITENATTDAITALGGTALSTVAQAGHYMIFVKPSTGTVLAVFYAEEMFTADDINSLPSLKFADRKAVTPLIGFYDGSKDGSTAKLDDGKTTTSPTTGKNVEITDADIINSGELYLEIKGSVPVDGFDNSKLEIKFADEHGHTMTVTVDMENDDVNLIKNTDGTFIYRFLMDDGNNNSFADIFTDFTPGDNITSYIGLNYNDGKDSSEDTDVAVGNSIFAFCSKNGDDVTAGVSNLRQLKNLEKYTPDANDDVTIEQISALGYDDDDYNWTDGGKYDENETAQTEFAPIDTAKLNNAGSVTYNGGGHSIDDITIITTGTDGAGIFSAPKGWTFENVIITDPTVSGGGPTGALADTAEDCTVKNCGVRFDGKESKVTSENGPAGGLIGKATDTDIYESYSALNEVSASDNSHYVGGLVGEMTDGSVKSSYADTAVLTGGKGAGGLIGQYTYTSASAATAISNTYAVTEQFGGNTVNAGFIADIVTGTDGAIIDNSYALVGSVMTDGKGAARYGFAPVSRAVENSLCLYYASSAFAPGSGSGTNANITEINAKYTGGDWEKKTVSGTHPYTVDYTANPDYSYMDGKAFPTSGIDGLDHYGNWPNFTAFKLIYNLNTDSYSGLTAGTAPAETVSGTDGKVKLTTDIPEESIGAGEHIKYRFVQWNTEKDGSGVPYRIGDGGEDVYIILSKDMTLYAIWEKCFSVTYAKNPDIGTAEQAKITNMPENQYGLQNGTSVTVSSVVPQRAPYTFAGWSTNPKANSADSGFNSAFTITGDITLYPVWNLLPYEVTAQVTVNGMPVTDDSLNIKLVKNDSSKTQYGLSYRANGVYTATADDGEYYLYYDGEKTDVRVIITDNDVDIDFELYTVEIVFSLNGGEKSWSGYEDDYFLSRIVRYDNKNTVATLGFDAPQAVGNTYIYTSKPTPDGSTWSFDISENGRLSTFHTMKVTSHKSIAVNYYTLTYCSTDNPCTGLPVDSTIYKENDYAKISTEKPINANQNNKNLYFSMWNDGSGTSYLPSTAVTEAFVKITGKTVLEAQWGGNLTVTYNANVDNSVTVTCTTESDIFYGGVKEAERNLDVGGNSILPGSIVLIESTAAKRTDYLFIGWNTKPNGTGTNYEPGQTAEITENITLYAQWAYNGTYTVIFYGNGGISVSGTTDNATFHKVQANVGLTLNGFSRDNYTFIGWSTDPDTKYTEFENALVGVAYQLNSDGSAYFDDGATVPCDFMKPLDEQDGDIDNVIRLYAVWSEERTYEVTFKLEKMTAGSSLRVCTLKKTYTAFLTYEGGFNPPKSASDIIVYVDNDANGQFSDGEKLIAIQNYSWDPYELKLTIPGEYVVGNIHIVAAAISGEHTVTYYDYLHSDDYAVQYDTGANQRSWQTVAETKKAVHLFITAGGRELSGRDAYIFKGWDTEPDGTGTRYVKGDVIEILGNMKLYAQWEKSTIAGAVIYNSYECTVNDKDTGRTSARYFLAKGEIQTVTNGETMTIINNGGQPHSSGKLQNNNANVTGSYFYYGILLPTGTDIGKYTVQYTKNGNTWTSVSTANAAKNKSVSSTALNTLYYLDTSSATKLGTLMNYSKTGYPCRFEYAISDYDYYVFIVQPSTTFKPDVYQIKITYTTENKSIYFTFDNSSRPTSGSAGYSYDSSEAQAGGWTDWMGYNGSSSGNGSKQYPSVCIYNGNVPSLDRTYANFFLHKDTDTDCQADFDVTAYSNGYQLIGINMRDSDGVIRTTANNLFSKNSDGSYTFNKAAMAELAPGDYTVIFDYIMPDGNSDYENDPSFILHVYNKNIIGYRYILLDVLSLYGSDGNIQFADIAFYSDETMMSAYRFSDSARIYKVTSTKSYTESENEALLIDNNSKTKYCAVSSGTDRLLIDVGDGYQFSPNLYGYLTYVNAADINEWAGRQPKTFAYFGSNADVLNKTATPLTTSGRGTEWVAITGGVTVEKDSYKVYSTSARYCYNSGSATTQYSYNTMDEAAVRGTMTGSPFITKTYNLTYDLNGKTATSWVACGQPSSANGDISGKYGDVVLGFNVPVCSGYYFLGWSEDSSATEPDYTPGSHYKLIYDTTLFAVWSATEPSFAVNYYPNLPSGKTESDLTSFPKNVTGKGNFVISDVVPQLSGYRFIGWQWLGIMNGGSKVTENILEKLGAAKTAFAPGETVNLTQNITLYAQWTESFAVSIPDSGDGFTTSGSLYFDKGETGSKTFTVTLSEGHENLSVSIDSGTVSQTSVSGNVYTFAVSGGRTSDATVTVKADRKKFDVTFKNADTSKGTFEIYIDGEKFDITGSYTVEYGRNLVFTIVPEEYHGIADIVNASWYQYEADSSNRQPKVRYSVLDVTGNTEVSITLTPNSYEVEFYQNYPSDSSDVKYGNSLTCYDNMGYVMPSAPSAPQGMIFTGWSTEKGTAFGVYSAGETVKFDSSLDPDGNRKISLYAIWRNKYTVTFKSYDGGTTVKTVSDIIDSTAVTAPDAPARGGYTFDGWYEKDSGGKYTSLADLTSVKSDMTVYARYSAITYTITYDNKYGTMPATYTTVYTVETETFALPVPTRTGYNFSAWNNGTGNITAVSNGSYGNLTLAEVWSPKSYALTLYDNFSGYKDIKNDTAASVSYASSSISNIKDVFAHTDAVIEGWYLDAACTKKLADANGRLIESVSGYTDSSAAWIRDGSATLYANWIQTSVITVTLDGNAFPGIKIKIGKTEQTTGADGKAKFSISGQTAQKIYIDYTGNGYVDSEYSIKGGESTEIKYYTATVNALLDGAGYNTPVISLSGGPNAVHTDGTNVWKFLIAEKDKGIPYTVFADGIVTPTAATVKGGESVDINYYTVTVTVLLNGNPDKDSTVSLSGGNSRYKSFTESTAVWEYIIPDSDTHYSVLINNAKCYDGGSAVYVSADAASRSVTVNLHSITVNVTANDNPYSVPTISLTGGNYSMRTGENGKWVFLVSDTATEYTVLVDGNSSGKTAHGGDTVYIEYVLITVTVLKDGNPYSVPDITLANQTADKNGNASTFGIYATDSVNYTVYADAVDTGYKVSSANSDITINYYTVSYNANGGTGGIAPAVVLLNGDTAENHITLSDGNAFTRTGYTLTKWSIGALGSDYTVTGTVTANAVWTADTYKLMLDANGTTYNETAGNTVTYDDKKLNIKSSVTDSVSALFGWYIGDIRIADYAGNLIAGISGYTDAQGKWIYEGGVTLKAHYVLNVTVCKDDSIWSGAKVNFSGNQLTTDANGKCTFDLTALPAGDAHITVAGVQGDMQSTPTDGNMTVNVYSVEYNVNGSTDTSSIATVCYIVNSRFNLHGKIGRTGYSFANWSVTDTTTVVQQQLAEHTVVGKTTVTALWTANEYNLMLIYNDNLNPSDSGQKLTYEVSTGFTIATLKSYCVNDGWYTAASGGEKIAGADGKLIAGKAGYTDSDGKWQRAGDCTLYAHLTYTYTVTVNKDGVAWDGAQVTFGGITTSSDGVYTFTFSQYKSGEITVANASGTDTMDVSDGTVTLNYYTLSYNLSGGSGTANPVIALYGTSVTLHNGDGLSKGGNGYYLKKWDIGDKGSAYTVNSTVTATAVWGGVQYTVTVKNASDATVCTGTVEYGTKTITWNTGYVLPSGYTYSLYTSNGNGKKIAVCDSMGASADLLVNVLGFTDGDGNWKYKKNDAVFYLYYTVSVTLKKDKAAWTDATVTVGTDCTLTHSGNGKYTGDFASLTGKIAVKNCTGTGNLKDGSAELNYYTVSYVNGSMGTFKSGTPTSSVVISGTKVNLSAGTGITCNEGTLLGWSITKSSTVHYYKFGTTGYEITDTTTINPVALYGTLRADALWLGSIIYLYETTSFESGSVTTSTKGSCIKQGVKTAYLYIKNDIVGGLSAWTISDYSSSSEETGTSSPYQYYKMGSGKAGTLTMKFGQIDNSTDYLYTATVKVTYTINSMFNSDLSVVIDGKILK